MSLRTPAPVTAGREATFALRVEDRNSALAVASLTPYLAAAAHILVIDSDALSFGHAHGSAVGALQKDSSRGRSAPGKEAIRARSRNGSVPTSSSFMSSRLRARIGSGSSSESPIAESRQPPSIYR